MAQSAQRTAADAAAAEMAHVFFGLRPQKGGASPHGHHYAGGSTGLRQRTGAAGLKLIHPAGGETEDVPIDIAGAYAGENNTADVLQGKPIAAEIVAQCAVQAGDLILSPDTEHGDHAAIGFQSHDFGGGASDINTQDYIHGDFLSRCAGKDFDSARR